MDFAALPPEINSGRMYAGAGTGPLTAAASAWSTLSQELSDAASEYGSVVTTLATSWTGPSSAAMQSAAKAYLGWLQMSAAQAQSTATQAESAAAAYASAFAATVPPPVIAANRAQLLMLVATNLFGQNTSAIAANEAAYAEMWAQDAAAMNAYAASSSATTAALPQFTPAAPTTNLAAATASVAAASLPSWLDNSTTTGQLIQALLSSGFPIDVGQLFGNFIALPLIAAASEDAGNKEAAATLEAGARSAPAPIASPSPAAPPAAPTPVSAASGAANNIGRLSVPPSWARAPETRPPQVSAEPQKLSVKGQTAIPAVPFMPVTRAGRSSQGRVREDPEYGHVSKILPPRHPAGG